MSSDNIPTLTHTEAAQAVIATLRAMRETIPNFVIPATSTAGRRFASAASVSPDFVEATVVAMKNSPALVRGGASADPETVRDLMSYAEAYGPVADEFAAMAKFLRHSVKAAKFEAGSEALTTYAVAQRLAKRTATSDLLPLVAAMQRTLGRKRTKPATPATPETPTTPEPPQPQS